MVRTQTVITRSAQETAQLGETLAYTFLRKKGRGRASRALCLYGELGSGKTTFAQGFAKGLGITSRLLSPTFIIVRRYGLQRRSGFLYHIDLYRIQKGGDIDALGILEMFADPYSFVLVEWAEKLGELLPRDRVDIRFKTSDDGRHEIRVHNLNSKY